MKSTPFTDIHIALGARMHEFAGYNMPIEYPTRITEEHLTVCRSVGVFDVSHMGEIWVKGPKALELVQKVTSNDAASLPVGKVQYSCFPNENGGIVDDLLVYHYQPEKYMLVVNASNIEKDFNNLLKHNSSIGAELENASENTALLAVQGPNALHVLQKLFPIDLSTIPYYTFKTTSLEGIGEVIISNTGYTGAGGFEIYFYPDAGVELWNRIMQAGAEYGIKPIGLGARDTLRLEMGFCLYGNDIDDTTSPIEAGLGWITKFTEDNNFVARPVLEKQKAEGVQRKLVAFKMLEKRSPRHGQPIEDVEGETIGIVTSGSLSPYLQSFIGLGYVQTPFSKTGTNFNVVIGGKKYRAEVAKLPFRPSQVF